MKTLAIMLTLSAFMPGALMAAPVAASGGPSPGALGGIPPEIIAGQPVPSYGGRFAKTATGSPRTGKKSGFGS